MRAGPSGSLELRTAIPPPLGSSASSTQLPLGLLRRLFCHVTDRRAADTPLCILSMSISLGVVVVCRRSGARAAARASALASAGYAEHDNARAHVRASSPLVIQME